MSTNGRYGSILPVPGQRREGPESALLGHSAFAPGMALPAPKQPFRMPRGLAQSGR